MDKRQWAVIGFLTVLAILLSLATLHSVRPAEPDSFVYARSGVSMCSGRGFVGLNGEAQVLYPPGYPFAIGLISKLGADPIAAGRAISVLASALAVVPLVLIAACFFGFRVGSMVGLIYVFMRYRLLSANTALSESLYILLVLAAVWLWTREREKHSLFRAAMVGLLFGLSYLVRPDGLMAALVLLLLSIPVHKAWKFPRRRSTAVAAAVLVLTVTPYVLFLHAHTGRWTLSTKALANYKQGIALYRGETWTSMSRMGADSKHSHILDLRETPPQFAKRYAANLRTEAGELLRTIGHVLPVIFVLGVGLEAARRGEKLRQFMPVFAALSVPLAVTPVFRTEPRLVFAASFAILILSVWQLDERLGIQRFAKARAGLWVVIPLALVMLEFVAYDLALAVKHEPQGSEAPAMAAWVNERVPPGIRLMVPPVNAGYELAFRSGHKFCTIPQDTLERALAAARAQGAPYIVLQSAALDVLSPELSKFARRETASPSLRLVGQWKHADNWMDLYEVRSSAGSGDKRN